MRRSVELAALEIVTTDHRFDMPRAGFDGEKRALDYRLLIDFDDHRGRLRINRGYLE